MKVFILSFMVCVIASTDAAPLLKEPAKQYLILTPQPALHIQPHLIQPISHLSRLQAPNQVLFYYPTAPLTSYQLNDRRIEFATLKQEPAAPPAPQPNPWDGFVEGWYGFWNQVNNTFSQGGAGAPEMTEPLMIKTAPMAMPLMNGETPASTVRLDNRYYVISGQPQFFGNFDALRNPLNPVFSLQTLQPIKARSNSEIEALPAEIMEQPAQPQLVPLQTFAPIEPIPLQLKGMSEQSVELMDGQQQGRELLDDEEEKKEDGKQGRSQSDMSAAENLIADAEMKTEELLKAADTMEMKDGASTMMASDEDSMSIAVAKPSAIALAGKGGIASASPQATALTDDFGLANASPQATSIAGDFLGADEEEEMKA